MAFVEVDHNFVELLDSYIPDSSKMRDILLMKGDIPSKTRKQFEGGDLLTKASLLAREGLAAESFKTYQQFLDTGDQIPDLTRFSVRKSMLEICKTQVGNLSLPLDDRLEWGEEARTLYINHLSIEDSGVQDQDRVGAAVVFASTVKKYADAIENPDDACDVLMQGYLGLENVLENTSGELRQYALVKRYQTSLAKAIHQRIGVDGMDEWSDRWTTDAQAAYDTVLVESGRPRLEDVINLGFALLESTQNAGDSQTFATNSQRLDEMADLAYDLASNTNIDGQPHLKRLVIALLSQVGKLKSRTTSREN